MSLRGLEPGVIAGLIKKSQGILDVEMFIPRRTLSLRLSRAENLNSDETGKVIRVAKVIARATQVFGNQTKALAWLKKNHDNLDGSLSPLGLCKSEEGALLVLDRLSAIDHGFSA